MPRRRAAVWPAECIGGGSALFIAWLYTPNERKCAWVSPGGYLAACQEGCIRFGCERERQCVAAFCRLGQLPAVMSGRCRALRDSCRRQWLYLRLTSLPAMHARGWKSTQWCVRYRPFLLPRVCRPRTACGDRTPTARYRVRSRI